MSTKRQYMPREKFPKMKVYHDTIDRLMLKSDILNGSNVRPSIYTRFWTKENIISELNIYTGDKEGGYTNSDGRHFSYIPFIEMKLQEVEENFKRHIKQMVASGHSKPEEMPRNLLEEKLQLEARQYTLTEEKIELERKLKTFTDAEHEIQIKKAINSKPIGSSVQRGGKIILVDFMPVKQNSNGIFYIDCPERPEFDGFSTENYFEFIVHPYKKAAANLAKANREKAIIAKRSGTLGETFSRNFLSGSGAEIPQFPEGCINYKYPVDEKIKK